MATTMTLTELILAVRQRADMVNSQFVTDSEVTSYINQSYFELYDLLVQKYGDDYYSKNPPYTFVTDGSSQLFSLPSDFYKLLGVDLQLSGGSPSSFVNVKRFNFAERNDFATPNISSTYYGPNNLRYRLNGSSLWLTPIPAGGQTIQIWYVPRLVQLSAGSDTADGISGWTEYIICDAAIKCLQKEESDISVLAAEKVALIQRIESAAENRDAANPSTVADVTRTGWNYGMGDGWGSW